MQLRAVGVVRSRLTDPEAAPKQGDEGAQGVFTTRSSDRPNPVGLHRVRVLEVDGLRLRVAALEAVDGTPIVDVKPPLTGER